jgi:D-aminoacyl-tRNA deacylase
MPVILYTRNSVASAAIAERMREIVPRPQIEPVDAGSENTITVPTDSDTDCMIVLSPHRSKSGTPVLTAHFPGNWDKADMGGTQRTLNIAHGTLLKTIVRELDSANKRHGLGWPVSIEADHHGPSAKVPMIFVEIGSTEKEWKDEKAALVVAEAVDNAMKKAKEPRNPEPETFFCVGGGHYAKEFTKLVLERDDFCAGHICPKYAIDSLEEDTFRQAIEKSTGPVRRVMVLKDGANSIQKKKVKELCEKFGVGYEEI